MWKEWRKATEFPVLWYLTLPPSLGTLVNYTLIATSAGNRSLQQIKKDCKAHSNIYVAKFRDKI